MIERFDPQKGERLQILDEKGGVRADLDPRLPDGELRRIYADMVLGRAADLKAFTLQRQGRLGTYAPSRGHEGIQAGAAAAMAADDWFFPYFRDLGILLRRGIPLNLYFLYWMGHEDGMRVPDGVNAFTIAIPVGSQIVQAAGAGLAVRLRHLDRVVFSTLGDGATSEGDFHEGLNFAGVFKTPNVFICVNNQWAISTPRSRQTAAPTLAEKARAYGFAGVQVDGNDVLACYAAAKEAADRARAGEGPTLIEAYTYRMSDHTTSDDAARYRQAADVAEWEKKDPIERFRLYLRGRGLSDDASEKAVREAAVAAVEKAVAEAEAVPPPDIEELFRHTYAEMPPELLTQLAETKADAAEAAR